MNGHDRLPLQPERPDDAPPVHDREALAPTRLRVATRSPVPTSRRES